MKKYSFLKVLAFYFLIISCSNKEQNNSSSNPTNSIKKISEIIYSGNQDDVYVDFNYENGNLKSISDANKIMKFYYNGSKITNTEIFTNNTLSGSYSISYNGDLLETISNTTNNRTRTLYNYNNGILVSKKDQQLINGNWETDFTRNYTFSNGNIVEEYSFFATSSIMKNSYIHDTKLNPMHYMNRTVGELIGLMSCNTKNYNNEIKAFSYSSSTSTTPILKYDYQITYNSQNLPINIKKYSASNNLISEATFEYN